MTTLVVARKDNRNATPQQKRTKTPTPSPPRDGIEHPKMVIAAEGLPPFTVPYAPRETQADGFVPQWDTVTRGGREPMLLRAGGSLITYGWDLVVAYFDPNRSIQSELTQLRAIAKSGARCSITFDPLAGASLWRLTSYSEQTVSRQHGTNKPTRAVCAVVFTEVSDTAKAVGPASGGSSGGDKGNAKGGDDDDKKRPKTYKFKKGDTLQSVAKEFYGRANLWDRLADHNGIKRPNQIDVGTVLKLPKKSVLVDARVEASSGSGGQRG